MCLIVYKRDHTSEFTNRQFKHMIARNDDGFGIMFRDGGRIISEKTVGSDYAKFAMFKKYRHLPSYALHARLKTHGKINEANCHPYEILNIDKGDPIDLYVMHNGVFVNAPNEDKDMSDTWNYVEYIIKPLLKSNLDLFWNDKFIQQMFSTAIGGNRLLFMRSDDVQNPVLIFNMASGEVRNNCWLSNNYGCDPWRETYTPPHVTTFSRQRGYWDATKREYIYEDDKKNTTATSCPTTNEEYEQEWQDYLEGKYDNKNLSSTTRLPLHAVDSKVINLKPRPMASLKENGDENLLYILRELRSLSDLAIKEYIRNDPDEAADIIMGLYAKCTMPYELIVKLIKTDKGCADMVKLIRCMAIDEDKLTMNKKVI